jgi:exodeoxyribonuclease VII large subunit
MILKPHFIHVAGKLLTKGMKVLLAVSPQFHENYGFSWIISDIDPTFTIGDMELKRKRIIAQLKEEGVFEANKELTMRMFPQRIAVISSATAAGYGDFSRHLSENEYGYAFHTTLFSSVMQGEGVEAGVISALNRIFTQIDQFDCVVITRGGGATSDLSGFDTLDLARNVANFPLPVLTAIGHDRDESILDMISNVRLKTPTAAAAFLIDRLHMVDETLDNLRNRLVRVTEHRLQQEKQNLHHLSTYIPRLFAIVKTQHDAKLNNYMNRCLSAAMSTKDRHNMTISNLDSRIKIAANHLLTIHQNHLEILQRQLNALDPQRVLERGYSITTYNGKAIQKSNSVKKGDVIQTRLVDGVIVSIVD